MNDDTHAKVRMFGIQVVCDFIKRAAEYGIIDMVDEGEAKRFIDEENAKVTEQVGKDWKACPICKGTGKASPGLLSDCCVRCHGTGI